MQVGLFIMYKNDTPPRRPKPAQTALMDHWTPSVQQGGLNSGACIITLAHLRNFYKLIWKVMKLCAGGGRGVGSRAGASTSRPSRWIASGMAKFLPT